MTIALSIRVANLFRNVSIESTQRVIEKDDVRVGVTTASESHALLLATRQIDTLLSDLQIHGNDQKS